MTSLIKASLRKQLWVWSKLVLFLSLLLFIYLKLDKNKNIPAEMLFSIKSVMQQDYLTLLVVVMMMPLNWGLEALKWKMLSKPVEQLSFMKALVGILTGLSLGFITPHGVGDYFGRILQNNHKDRIRLIGAIMLGRFCQMLPTFLFGMMGVYYFLNDIEIIALIVVSVIILILVIYMMYLFIFQSKKSDNTFKRKIRLYFGIISDYSVTKIVGVAGLSFVRYLIFALQFMMVIQLFVPDTDGIIRFAGVTWIFLMKSILPTFNFLSDLGVREFSAVYFFDQYMTDLVPVISASLTIWIINILVPSIVGAPFTLQMKLQTK